ncbi:MAG: flagellar basal body rod C-terminal domain-containing protein [Microthrixaceae bacterium]
MNALFGSLDVAYSGMDVYKAWLDATADNVANVNTVRRTSEDAFQSKYVIARSLAGRNGSAIGRGTSFAGVALGDPNGKVVYDPTHPLADAQGMVRYPDVDLGEQMTNMLIAQRAYQANVTVFERARDAYTRALEIGK